MFRKLRLLFVLMLLALLVSPVVLLFAALEDEPSLADAAELTAADVSRAKMLIERNDPRSLADGQTGSIELQERDINLMLAYAMSRFDAGASRVELIDGAALVELSLRLPANPVGNFSNVRLRVSAAGQRELEIESLHIGRVRIPAPVAAWGARYVAALIAQDDLYDDVRAAIDTIDIRATHAEIRYEWQRELAERVAQSGRNTLSGEVDSELVSRYFAESRRLGSALGSFGERSLWELARPVFAVAGARSSQGGDPVAENSAALLGMAIYVLGINPDLILTPNSATSDLSPGPTFTLRGRKDLAQHFLVSAAVTAAAGSLLADALGLEKEISDSQGGSGFSFADLAADRAGVRFAEFATDSASTARRTQSVLADSGSESSFMPSINGLPESMNEAEFERRFGGVGSGPYRSMLADIEQRIDALPLYR